MNSPAEIAKNYLATGTAKTKLPLAKMFVLSIFAGMFIAIAGVGATTAAVSIASPSVAKLVGACIFPAGLALSLIAGSELFTGNCLIIMPVLSKKATVGAMLKNWLVVYAGNFVGALIVSSLVVYSHTFNLFDGNLAASAVATADAKCALSFSDAFLRGIMCNLLVCLGVWMAFAATDVAGKIIGLYFPVMIFVLCGFEHSVANMYYISSGLMASDLYQIAAANLSIGNFIGNLIPVTLGNIVGGFIVGIGYWYAYIKHN